MRKKSIKIVDGQITGSFVEDKTASDLEQLEKAVTKRERRLACRSYWAHQGGDWYRENRP
jgi:hypothetical protein